jgi:hypothetical protein
VHTGSNFPREQTQIRTRRHHAAGVTALLAALVTLWTSEKRATAAEVSTLDDGPTIELHGFVSQGALKSTANNYLAKSARGSLEFSEVGINFTSQLTDKLRFGLQLFARDLGATGNYNAKTDWYYLDYRWKDWLGVRAGRVKLPFGLYNDTSDIDSARTQILLPQSIYPIANRDFLLAQTGLELYGYLNLRGAGALEYRLYGGTIFIAPSAGVKDLDVPYVAGGRLIWETPVEGLRLGGSVQALKLNLGYVVGPETVSLQLPVVLGVGSVEFVRRDLLLAAEFSQWRVRIDSSDRSVLPGPMGKDVTVSERAYLMATYRVNPWLWPGLYYSMLFPDVANRTFTGPSQDMQHDVAGSLRFDVNAHWLFKLEGHYMHGTADLDPTLNGNVTRDKLERNWAVFLAKTTAYF